MRPAVLVGLSGGIDSFVTALMLQQQDYHVIGANLQLWKKEEKTELEDLCNSLHIELLTYDGREAFRHSVVEPFVNDYMAGRTPNPCAICNNYIKWDMLCRLADKKGIKHIATGHYVRITSCNGFHYICKGVDPNKDQSYFLWGLNQHILSRALTPLGEYTKAEVKTFAEAEGYTGMTQKKESMSICFLEGADYRSFVAGYAGNSESPLPGDIVDINGCVIGRHSGLLNYTVGQKREIPLRDGQALYVAEIRPEENVIVADLKKNIYKETVEVDRVNVIDRGELSATDIEIKVRGLGLNPEGYVKINQKNDGSLSIRLASPAWAVASGQPVAFYRGERLIGGGIVK